MGIANSRTTLLLKLVSSFGFFSLAQLAIGQIEVGIQSSDRSLNWVKEKDSSLPTNEERLDALFTTTNSTTGQIHLWLITAPVIHFPGTNSVSHPKAWATSIFNAEDRETNDIKFTFHPGKGINSYFGSVYYAKGWNVLGVSQTNSVDIVASEDKTTIMMAIEDTGLVYWTTNSGTSWNIIEKPGTYWLRIAYYPGDNASFFAKATINSVDLQAIQSATNENWYAFGSEQHGNSLSLAGGQSGAPPALDISRLKSCVLISWPSTFTNFVVQQTLDLAKSDWVTLTNIPAISVSNQLNEMVIPSTNANGFFRLVLQ